MDLVSVIAQMGILLAIIAVGAVLNHFVRKRRR